MLSDITKAECPDECIYDSVAEDICIRVAGEASVEGNLDPSKNEFPPLDKTVRIISHTDTDHISLRSRNSTIRLLNKKTM